MARPHPLLTITDWWWNVSYNSRILSHKQSLELLDALCIADCIGAPIPEAQKYWSDGTTDQVASDARKVNLNNALGNAAKSAVAVQTSKTLGLRSLG